MKKLILLFAVSLFFHYSFSQTNWSLSNTGIPSGYSPNNFAVAPNGDIYLVCSQWNGSSFTPKLLKSTDNGNHWTEINMSGLTNVQNTNSIIFAGSKLLLAASNSSTAKYYVYASENNGANWSLSNSGIPDGYSPNDFAIAPNGDIYLVCSQWNGSSFMPKLLKSTDNGDNWKEVNLSGLTNVQNTNSIIFVGSELLLAASNSSTAKYYVYASGDNGVNWTLSDTGIPDGYSPNDFTLTSNNTVYLASSKWNGNSFTPKLLKSTNKGNSWTEITNLTGLTSLQNTNCIAYTNNQLLLGGSNSTKSTYYVFKSDLDETGVNDRNSIFNISLYPNPFKKNITIKNIPINSKSYVIINDLGHIVLKGEINSTKLILNTSKLNSGLYILKINPKSITKKIIKQ